MHLPYNPAIPLLDIYPRGGKKNMTTQNTCTNCSYSFVCNSQKLEIGFPERQLCEPAPQQNKLNDKNFKSQKIIISCPKNIEQKKTFTY